MTWRAQQIRRNIAVALALFVAGMLALTAYTLWRLQTQAVTRGLEKSAAFSRSAEDFLTQSLSVTELVAASVLPPGRAVQGVRQGRDVQALERRFVATLRHAPFLRSLSLLDEQGRIVASSNPANRGLHMATDAYLPQASGQQAVLRMGPPWRGRDFAGGRPSTPEAPIEPQLSSFIPFTRTLVDGARSVTLLVALNPDFFINHLTQTLKPVEGEVAVLRYDGTLLLSTDPTALVGAVRAYVARDLGLPERESGLFEPGHSGARAGLTSFRASRLYPLVVLTRLDRTHALASWRAEARTLLVVVVPTLLLLCWLAFAFYRRQLQDEALREESLRLQRINARVFDVSAEAIIITDARANILSVNHAFTHITGYSAHEVLGLNPRLLASGQQDKDFYQSLWAHLLRHDQWQGELRNRRKDGGLYDVHLTITVSRDAQGQAQHFIGHLRDITEHKQAQEKLHLAASVFTHAREAILIAATDGTIVDVNESFTRITGYTRDEVLGQNPRLLNSGTQSQAFYAAMWSDLNHKGHWYGEVWNRRKNGEVYAEMQTISAVCDAQGNTEHYVALFSDITASKQHQLQLEHIAHYDALTHLPNRVLLADRLRQGMTQALRRGQVLAVAFLDLDGFKGVNDAHGHESGDQLLITVAHRMKQALRDGDTLARIGGDEFVVVLLDLPDVSASVTLLTRLLAAAARPVEMGPQRLQVSASLGVTFYPQTQDLDADQLLRQADQAMYQAKLAGKNRYHVFDAEQDRSVRGYHASLDHIRHGLAEKEFVLYYQPKVNMRTGMVVGVEALVRWQHPINGLLLPAVFLPAIEDHPLAVELGEWVIDAALQQIVQWRAAGLSLPVSVNVGARQLQQDDFVERLHVLLAAYPQIQPGDLALEVLETSALEDLAHVSHVMEACQSIGVTFALDDFGTGYSSLTYLKRLPVTLLKIDQSFVRDMLDDPDDLAILEGVIGLASAFRREVIAEGVETVAHGTLLLQLGCELAQGYGVARPMLADALPGWAATWRQDPAWIDLPVMHRADLPLLFASVEHRAWVASMEKYLYDDCETLPPQDLHQCNFGHWLDTEGRVRYGESPAYGALGRQHRAVHVLAAELLALKASGRGSQALVRLGELLPLRDALLAQLTTLAQDRPR